MKDAATEDESHPVPAEQKELTPTEALDLPEYERLRTEHHAQLRLEGDAKRAAEEGQVAFEKDVTPTLPMEEAAADEPRYNIYGLLDQACVDEAKDLVEAQLRVDVLVQTDLMGNWSFLPCSMSRPGSSVSFTP